MRLRIHHLLSAAYALGALALMLVVNRGSAVNEAWVVAAAVGLTIAWLFARRNFRDNAVMTVALMAVPFLYACLLGLVAAVMTWQQGGPFTGALLVAGLAGAVAMGTFAGYFLHRARQLWKWTP